MITICAEGHATKARSASAHSADASAPENNAYASAWLNRYRASKPTFACILSFTATGLIPDISAAGATPEARRTTALADGEFLRGEAPSRLPSLPAGVSPAVITRAVLSEQKIPLHLFSTGLPNPLTVPHVPVFNANKPVIAKAVNTGQAMTLCEVSALFNQGLHWGKQLARTGYYLILGESVVGGTTTAQAVLTGLGYPACGRMGSSHRHSNHLQKQQLTAAGLAIWQRRGNLSALATVAAVGDPMQVVAAGMAIAASRNGGVLLAGGSQMLAVYALAAALAREQAVRWDRAQVVVGTTRWVIDDASADTIAIAQALGAPYLASNINFSQSPYVQLRAYERGFVKEGVGAGGCAIAAHLYQGWTRSQLRHAVENQLRQCF